LDWQIFDVVLLYYQGTSGIDVVSRGLRDTYVSMVYPREQSLTCLNQ
jgi:hypothetical protein